MRRRCNAASVSVSSWLPVAETSAEGAPLLGCSTPGLAGDCGSKSGGLELSGVLGSFSVKACPLDTRAVALPGTPAKQSIPQF
jgi:hypothetical protein